MTLRPCLGIEGQPCGELTPSRRCPTHQRQYEQARPSRRVRGRYDSTWRRIRAAAIAQHPWCEVCLTPGSESNPLTGDHRVALENGGLNRMSNVAVLCRSCNSSKGARV